MTTVARLDWQGCMYDISVGAGFTVINPAKTMTSGEQSPSVDYRPYMKHCAIVAPDPCRRGKVSWKAVAIYALHKIGDIKSPADICAALPPLAAIGETRAILPTMERFQYQWTGQTYGWVPAEAT